jgi:hypothetical protein
MQLKVSLYGRIITSSLSLTCQLARYEVYDSIFLMTGVYMMPLTGISLPSYIDNWDYDDGCGVAVK